MHLAWFIRVTVSLSNREQTFPLFFLKNAFFFGRQNNAEKDWTFRSASVTLAIPMKRLKKNDLKGLRILVTAGPTVEDIDPVRFISNRSSGKMGAAIANCAANRGAEVVFVHGPLRDCGPSSSNVCDVPIRSAAEMHAEVMRRVSTVDCAIMAAAVCDFSPEKSEPHKIKKATTEELVLKLKRTPDILSSVGRLEDRPFLVGFAAETENVSENAIKKMRGKHCDMICANSVVEPEGGFASDDNRLTIHTGTGRVIELPLQPKSLLAERLLDEILLQSDRFAPH